MRYFAWDDKHLSNDLSPEIEFTKIYKENKGKGLGRQEACCLSVMLPASAMPVEDGDWFVGRRVYRPIGISPSYWNDETDGLDHVSYYADIDRLTRVMNRQDQTEENRIAIGKLIEYWKDENINAKVRSHFDDEMVREMPSDLWCRGASGVIFGLYRLAGAQLDYNKLVSLGLPGLEDEINSREKEANVDENQLDFLEGLKSLISTLRNILANYEKQLEQMIDDADEKDAHRLEKMKQCVHNLQNHAPSSFMEAIQLVWLYSSFSGTLDFGRADDYLGDWYVHDIDNGIISHEQALELLLSFYRLMQKVHSRDTRFILGGLGRHNPENADRFDLIAMEASAIHGEMQPQVSLRMYKGMSPVVRKAAMDFLQKGMSYPLLYNDEASMHAVARGMHLEKDEQMQYSFFGCGEYVINHCSMGTPNDIINLEKALEVTLHEGYDVVGDRTHGLNLGKLEDFDTFDKLFEAYKKQVEYFAAISARHQKLVYDTISENGAMLMTSMLLDDCISRAKPLCAGGVRYLAGTYETYGNITVSDSLVAIRKLVYEDKVMSLRHLVEILDSNFSGCEEEHQMMLDCPKFGNDDTSADSMANEVNTHIFDFAAKQADINGLSSYLVVMINNDANTVLGRKTLASADGRKAWAYLSNGNGPMAGMDKNGLISMLHSMASTKMSHTAGTAQNLKLSRDIFVNHRDDLDDLIDAAFDMGILSLNISVMNPGDMEDAMVHPEKYRNLFVRVGGFSARFIELDPGTQQDVLHRTIY